MISKYRKKPVQIEACKIPNWSDKEKAEQFTKWLHGNNYTNWYPIEGGIKLKTLEGWMESQEGNYVIRGIKGEFYCCDCEIFEESYEKIED